MKINELVNIMNQNKTKLTKAEQIQALLKKELEVKEYLSIKAKKELVQKIADECILYEDGVFKFDDIDKYICFTMRTIAAYTDLELSNDLEEDYDLLCQSKLLDAVIEMFKKEYDDVNILLQMRCDYLLSGNTLEAQVGRFFDDISAKVDKLADAMSNKVNSLDLNTLLNDKNIIEKIVNFAHLQK